MKGREGKKRKRGGRRKVKEGRLRKGGREGGRDAKKAEKEG